MGKYFVNAIVWALSIFLLSFLASYAFAYVFFGCWILLPLMFLLIKVLRLKIFTNWSIKDFFLTYLTSLLFSVALWFGLVFLGTFYPVHNL